jgi:hypothetical protein
MYPVNDPQAVRNPRPDTSYPQSRSYTETIYAGSGIGFFSGLLVDNGVSGGSYTEYILSAPVIGLYVGSLGGVSSVVSYLSGGYLTGGYSTGGYLNISGSTGGGGGGGGGNPSYLSGGYMAGGYSRSGYLQIN